MVIIIDFPSSLCCIECDITEVDVKCMHTIFGGHGLSGFGDIATCTFKIRQIFFLDHAILVKKLNWLKNFMQVEVDGIYMCKKFGGHGYSGFGDITTFKFGQIYLLDHGLGASGGGLMLALPPPPTLLI